MIGRENLHPRERKKKKKTTRFATLKKAKKQMGHDNRINVRWSLCLDGLLWAGLLGLSVMALYDRMNPPWLLMILWFSLHPAIMLAYLFARWTTHYSRYIWAMKSWITTTTYLWFFQSLFFIHHIVTRGFFVEMEILDSASAMIAAAICLNEWFEAFWAEMVRPFSLIKYGVITKYINEIGEE